MLRLIISVITAGSAIASPPAARNQDDCRYEETRTADMAAAGISLLDLEAGAGSLRIEGRAGIGTIQVRGRACASSRQLLDEVRIRARRNGGTYEVVAEGPDNTYGSEYARMDLVIEVPLSMAAHISDGSGEMKLSNVGALDITDGSGEVEIDGVEGDVTIEDGSGELRITNVSGDVRIEDGSGEITVTNVRGSVTIDDGSGSINVSHVGRGLNVTSDGSGDVQYSSVTGSIRVPQRRHR